MDVLNRPDYFECRFAFDCSETDDCYLIAACAKSVGLLSDAMLAKDKI